ncbi:hypothetical protein I79_000044 [Cricetulus griseus]|uniref:Uncharacterized protein n=1 Tax=Cricetulus griseus TaxID=10029 RepID=G3GRA1_CRIGR|nr:hypothetical protein I79_000044 [Cricetulus griseus]
MKQLKSAKLQSRRGSRRGDRSDWMTKPLVQTLGSKAESQKSQVQLRQPVDPSAMGLGPFC